MSTATLVPPIDTKREERHHEPATYLDRANRRKSVYLAILFAALMGCIYAIVVLGLRSPQPYVVALTDHGEFIISTPTKALDIHDLVINQTIKRDLRYLSWLYFSRSRVTAQRDYDAFKVYLPDQLLGSYVATAEGPKGWLTQLEASQIPEIHAEIRNIELSQADTQTSPYRAHVFVTREMNGKAYKEEAILTFIVDPVLAGKRPEISVYNPLGVFLVKPIEEFPDLLN